MSDKDVARLSFVVPDLGVGGAERHVVTLASRLDTKRFRTSIVCLGERGELADEVAEQVPVNSYGHSKRQVLKTVWLLTRAWRRERPDVVVSRGYSAEVIGRVAALLAGVPHSVVWVRNCGDTDHRGAVRSAIDRVFEPLTDAFFGVAQAQVPYMVQGLGIRSNKVHIIHNGVDVAAFSRPGDAAAGALIRAALGFAADDVVIGILAALRVEKDHELFLAAAARVRSEAPAAKFLIVGDGERRAELETLGEKLGISEHVVFAGYRSDVASILGVIDVFALTSFTVECFPMSLLEAMAASLPAVCTDVGGVREIVEEEVTGYLVPAKDEIALTDRLVALVANPELRRSFGRAGHARVAQRFTLARSVDETERQLIQVVRG